MTVRVQRSAAFEPLERILHDFESALPHLPEEIIPRSARRRAAEQLRQLGWPQTRDEQWRYLNLRSYERVGSFAPSARERAGEASEPALPAVLPQFERLIYVDGASAAAHISSSAVQIPTTRAGAIALSSRALESWLPEQRLGFLTDMFALDTVTLRVQGDRAIELLFITRARSGAVYPRLHLELAPDSRLTLIERHLAETPSEALVCASTSIELGRAAQLTHYRLQQCAAGALFSDSLTARVHEGARYRVRQVAVGAASARTAARVRLLGRAAGFEWQAIALGLGEQVQDSVLKVEHAAPETQTQEVFRGIADERARVAFNGHIHIEPTAGGAQARQSLRGLIEAHGEVDLRPRLEIHTDEVSAQHGATTGRLDENLLFYLLSRGIDRDVARTLLKWAFLSDVLRQIELPQLRAEAEHSVAGQLKDVLAVGALS